MFSSIFPDQKDPDNEGHYLCRLCGKPTTETRRRYYCSDECYWNCQKAVTWIWVRREVWERDDKKCVKCGVDVKLEFDHRNRDNPSNLLDTVECHHDPLQAHQIHSLAWTLVNSWEFKDLHWKRGAFDDMYADKDEEKLARRRVFARVYTLLYLDMNNLKSLCPECHKKAHAAQPKLVAKANDNQKSLFDYLTPEG